MGKKYSGIPFPLALQMKRIYKLVNFVETGTLVGKTAKWAAIYFEQVNTIELDHDLHVRATRNLINIPNVRLHKGNSGELLLGILESLGKPALIWLDSHWSRDLGYQRPEIGECPVLAEIKAIVDSKEDHVVLIDDARYFVNSPPSPHRAKDWPNVKQIREAFGDKWRVEVIRPDDVILVRKNG